MIIGYARVSTDGQTLDAQHAALTAAGADKVFAEKVSGAMTDRKALAKAISTEKWGQSRAVFAAVSKSCHPSSCAAPSATSISLRAWTRCRNGPCTERAVKVAVLR
jgi:hypothetical protein